MKINIRDRILSAFAYFLGIPAFYIILTENRKRKYVGFHGARAFFLWCVYFVVFFGVRFCIDLIWRARYIPWLERVEHFSLFVMGIYALYCGCRSLIEVKYD